MMKNLIFIMIVLLSSGQVIRAQEIDWTFFNNQKHVLDSVFDAENYAKALILTESQISLLKKNEVHDSLYHYVYKLGRCYWKLKGVKDGYHYSEKLMQHVFENDTDTMHHLSALNDMSWFYYETGNDSLCLQTDLLFIETCRKYSRTPNEKFSDGYYNLGFDYLAIGNNRLAEENWQRALDMMLSNPDVKPSTLMKCFNALGTALYRSGDYERARSCYNQCLAKAQTIEDKYESNSNIGNSYGNLALIAEDEGNYILARQLLEKSMSHRKLAIEAAQQPQLKQQEQDNVIKGYGSLATIYLAIGEVKKCEQLLNLIKSEREKLLEADDPRKNLVYEQFASLYRYTNEFDKALYNILIYKESCKKNYGDDSFWTGFALIREAQIRHEMGEFQLAVDLFTEAIALFSKLEDEDAGKELSGSYRKRALVYQDMGNASAALNDLQRALEAYKSSRSEYDPELSQCYLAMAEVKMNSGDFSGAMNDVEEALRRTEHYKSITQSAGGRLSNYIPLLPDVYYTRARIAEKGNSTGALENAYSDMILSVEYAKNGQSALDTDESALIHYQSYTRIFNHAQDISHRMYESTGNMVYIEKLLQLGEENKTVMLRRQLNSFSSIAFGQVPDSIIIQENKLQKKLRKGEITADSIESLFASEKQFETLVNKIKEEQPHYYALKYNTLVSNVQEIQKELLNDGANLLEYVVTDSTIYALIITRENYHALKLHRGKVGESIADYNKAILSGNMSELTAISNQLYKHLFEPIRPFLKGTILYIVPDDELFNLNFETLCMGATEGDVQYLIQDYTISYLLSATTAIQFSKLKRNLGSGVLAIAPGFSDEMKSKYAMRKSEASFFDNNFMEYIQQPFAVTTATNIASLFSGKAYTGMQATEANFRSSATEYGVIHFGTHTEVNNLSPLMSRLILNPALTDSTDNNDGYLHAYEIYAMELRAELAVLTACETGTGKQESGEGVMSLAHSFAYAGCPSVVMSVWQIDEKTSAEIIEYFYRNLSDGMPKNEALRQAKLQFMKEHPGDLSAPYYWAGMVLLGDTDALESTSSFPWFWMIFGLSLGAILIIIWKKRSKNN